MYTINYSFIGNNGLTISGQLEILAGDNNEARHTAVKMLKDKYAVNVRLQDVYWKKP